ncbi:MAG: lipocalin-like domain-containing protein [Gammaproteobacteria bacterium]|nr:lipocalin-like domain-containing protein [Gammaproteobacteria bacterium]
MKRILLLLSFYLLAGCGANEPGPAQQTALTVSSTMGGTVDPGFARALTPREFVFPADHGAHPEYATEWWYFTGNLSSDRGEAFGYQLTLFRVGLKPGSADADSNWRSHQLYMGHLALSAIDRQQHLSEERFSRAAAGLAGADNNPLRVWLGPWSINGSEDNIFPLTLQAATDRFGIELSVEAGSKPPVLQGDRGLSQKSAAAGNASYYYSYTRLPTSGSIRLQDRVIKVEGNSWFDREWSSSALAADQAGWDWFSLQLDSGQDLMFYQMRGKDGQPQIYSKGVLVDREGRVEPLSLDNTRLSVTDTWTSASGTRYPIGWQMRIPRHAIDIEIQAAFADQEMAHTVRYWEGAVKVDGSHRGLGYLELSGYSDN